MHAISTRVHIIAMCTWIYRRSFYSKLYCMPTIGYNTRTIIQKKIRLKNIQFCLISSALEKEIILYEITTMKSILPIVSKYHTLLRIQIHDDWMVEVMEVLLVVLLKVLLVGFWMALMALRGHQGNP